MMHVALATVAPFLNWAGPVSAIVIGLYIFILSLLFIGLGAAAVFVAYWVHKQIGFIKLLRPTIETVNKTTEATMKGIAPTEYQNKIISTIAAGPAQIQNIDRQVEQYANRAVNIAIEFQARTLQVQTVAKALFLPKLARRAALKAELNARLRQIEAERHAPEIPDVPVARDTDGHQPAELTAPQPQRDASLR
jgi:hypothetical protein